MKKIVATGLALSMLMGGAVLSSSNVHASSPTKDYEVIVSSTLPSVEPQKAGLVKAAATGVGMGVAWAAAKVTGWFGSSGMDTSRNYEYSAVQEAFDQ
ncbi:hypothetical protein [Thermoactinomyces sp. DSM 45892]|uniref:hypothetical protein n=1 Tax=Thermoactinomyces sp. DSM 45892 TaxID=1882753 RepID=UPI0008974DD8|nr:hypothetical protein [Thermoactinomyces sp. DSM 45892]SDY46056.1 hypothetical protein SAMN05444416_1057 [Thermoactinomyces sp. DSM 45892]